MSSGGKNKRTVKFTWHAASTTQGFWDIGYPGVLKNCETCHLPGTYDFSATASASALPNKQFRTVATGFYAANGVAVTNTFKVNSTNNGCIVGSAATAGTALSEFSRHMSRYPRIRPTVTYGTGYSINLGTAANGGSIYATRAAALATTEQCMLCHGTGRVADIKAMHEKQGEDVMIVRIPRWIQHEKYAGTYS